MAFFLYKKNKLLYSKLFWVSFLYFSEGLPLGIFYDIFPVFFRQSDVPLNQIGILSLFGISWSLKFLWAPLIDFTRRHRFWMATADIFMGLVMIFFAKQIGLGLWSWVAISFFTIFSATKDIAIDGYTIEKLNKNELGIANGFRIAFYRVGMLASGVLLIISDQSGWSITFLYTGFIFFILSLLSLLVPKEDEVKRKKPKLKNEFYQIFKNPIIFFALIIFLFGLIWPLIDSFNFSFIIFLKKYWFYKFIPIILILISAFLFSIKFRYKNKVNEMDNDGPIFGVFISLLKFKNLIYLICFILLFKLADSSMGFMIKPFWVDSGFTNAQIGLVSVNLGLILSILGGLVGGWYTDRVGIFKALWILGLFQALSNLGYVFAAYIIPETNQISEIEFSHQLIMYSASAIESFTGGLGTAAFLAFLMSIVSKSRATTEYAILSSIFAFSRSIAGWFGGIGAQELGYTYYFLFTFFLAFPAYILLPKIKEVINQKK